MCVSLSVCCPGWLLFSRRSGDEVFLKPVARPACRSKIMEQARAATKASHLRKRPSGVLFCLSNYLSLAYHAIFDPWRTNASSRLALISQEWIIEMHLFFRKNKHFPNHVEHHCGFSLLNWCSRTKEALALPEFIRPRLCGSTAHVCFLAHKGISSIHEWYLICYFLFPFLTFIPF
jgi:hypothetical protein